MGHFLLINALGFGKRVYYGRRLARSLVCLLLVCGVSEVRAQAQHEGGPFVAVRAGANLVGNTYRFRDRKPEAGIGGSVGTALSRYWAVELETWIRTGNPQCCLPRRRETLHSVSVLRLLAADGLQPYMLGGVTWLHASRRELQVQVGVGVQFPVARRIRMAVDLRGNGGGSTMIVRPTAALIYFFQ
jgi:hypothetical protein